MFDVFVKRIKFKESNKESFKPRINHKFIYLTIDLFESWKFMNHGNRESLELRKRD